MQILNLGSGWRTSPYCVNIDWSMYLRAKTSRIGSALAPVVLKGERLERFRSLDENIVVHDLRRGIPAEDNSVDVVYHSHLLAHIDHDRVPGFFAEIRRVLVSNGIHRIVVPDLERLAREYLAHLDTCIAGEGSDRNHDGYVAAMIELMVRKESVGSSQQPRLARLVENALLGDARRRGETYQWMYDRANLGYSLTEGGFRSISVVDHVTSAIPDWDAIGLDLGADGGAYKPGSLYVECFK